MLDTEESVSCVSGKWRAQEIYVQRADTVHHQVGRCFLRSFDAVLQGSPK